MPFHVHSSWNILFPFSSWLLRFNYLGRCLVAGSSKKESIGTPQTWHDHMQNLRWESIWNTQEISRYPRKYLEHTRKYLWQETAPPLQFVRWKWTRNTDSRRLRHQNEPPRRRKQPQTASNTGQTRVQNERQRHVSICCGCEKKTKNIASKLEQPVQVKAFESKVAEPRGLRGIPEMSGIPPDKAFKKDMEKVESFFEFLAGKNCNVKSLKRVGQFKDLSPKPRTLIVQVANEACRTLLLQASRELKNHRELSGPVFLSKELTIEELKTENESLRTRKVNIDQGVPREKLRIRNLKLEMQNDQGIWEEVYDNVADSAEAPSAWLPNRNHETQVHLLMWNVISMLDLNRRTALSNALALQQFHIISLCETWLVDTIPNSGLFIGNRSIFRRDRQPKRTGKSSHGGVLIAVDSSIPCKEITELNVLEDVVGIACHFLFSSSFSFVGLLSPWK